jgi:D-sedoheptulose 7-phosphate isomerase
MATRNSLTLLAATQHSVLPPVTFCSYFASYQEVLAQLPFSAIEQAADHLYAAYEEQRRVFIFGNGGSAALASHFACDLAKGTVLSEEPGKRFRALSLAENTSLLTAWANDSNYEHVFAQQLRNFVECGDLAFAISGSGCSPNVLLALEAAREAGAINIGLTGFHGGKMKELCDVTIIIPSDNMQIIEDIHLSTTHALFSVIRQRIISARERAMLGEPGAAQTAVA